MTKTNYLAICKQHHHENWRESLVSLSLNIEEVSSSSPGHSEMTRDHYTQTLGIIIRKQEKSVGDDESTLTLGPKGRVIRSQ